MLHNWIRVFYSDNGVLTDYSVEAQNNADTIPLELVAGQDYVYVGQYFPFNNLFFQLDTANTVVSVMSAQYWDGKVWRDAVDFIDSTKLLGKTLARNGVIQWSPDRNNSWLKTEDTTDRGAPTELSTLEIYELHWMRLKVSVSLSAGTIIKDLGYAFTANHMLSSIDPEINEYLVPWGGVSKTNWDEQIQLASNHVVADLRSRGLVVAPGNVLRFDDVSLATAYRTLQIIYSRLGEAFAPRKQDAQENYEKLLNLKGFTFDTNRNGLAEKQEIAGTTGGLVR